MWPLSSKALPLSKSSLNPVPYKYPILIRIPIIKWQRSGNIRRELFNLASRRRWHRGSLTRTPCRGQGERGGVGYIKEREACSPSSLSTQPSWGKHTEGGDAGFWGTWSRGYQAMFYHAKIKFPKNLPFLLFSLLGWIIPPPPPPPLEIRVKKTPSQK